MCDSVIDPFAISLALDLIILQLEFVSMAIIF